MLKRILACLIALGALAACGASTKPPAAPPPPRRPTTATPTVTPTVTPSATPTIRAFTISAKGPLIGAAATKDPLGRIVYSDAPYGTDDEFVGSEPDYNKYYDLGVVAWR
ncbi:hypothetical protein ACFV9C_30320 [Kribbella sp. NPDC059898]|uniref:hypothetical protein n=1 Tax=Kribbella sp. NPDC059898 TaxID=3346995 RepID=UPI0036510CC2